MKDGIVVRLSVGDAHSFIAAEGSSYSPDMVHDMYARAAEGLSEALRVSMELGYIQSDIEDEDEDEEDEEEVTDNGTGIEWL